MQITGKINQKVAFAFYLKYILSLLTCGISSESLKSKTAMTAKTDGTISWQYIPFTLTLYVSITFFKWMFWQCKHERLALHMLVHVDMFILFSYDSAACCISCMYLICLNVNTNTNVKMLIHGFWKIMTISVHWARLVCPGFTSGCLATSVCWDKVFTFTIQFVYRIKKQDTSCWLILCSDRKQIFLCIMDSHRLYRHYL